ncbi:MAG: hypothetical protein WBQ19_06160 [Terriglobales bacterium]
MDTQLLHNINSNLEVIIGLLLRTLPDSDATHLRERIRMLSDMGMRPTDIAKVLGKSINQVNVTLSQSRNSSKNRKGRKA